MPFEVVHGNRRNLQRVRQRRRERPPDEQRTDQPGPGRIGDGVEIAQPELRLREHGLDHRQQLGDVIPGRELGDHAPIGRVQLDLAREPLGPDSGAGLVEGDAGLVAARFDPKDTHRQALQLTGGAANMPLFSRLSRPIFLCHSQFRPSPFCRYSMPGVRIRESEHFDAALRRFKRACEKAGVLTELRRREFYEKPTQERKRKKAAAVKRHMKRNSRTPTTRRRRLY